MSNMSTHARVRRLTVLAMLTAIIWFLAVTPIGFTIPFFGIQMTFIHIPMIIGTLMEGLSVGTILGGMFGLTSLVNSFTNPVSIYSPMFQNPLVSVLPRLLIAPVIWGVLLIMRKLLPGKAKLHYAVAGIVGALANTVFVLSALSLCVVLSPGTWEGISIAAIWALAANSPIEMFSAAIVSVAVMTALNKVYARTK